MKIKISPADRWFSYGIRIRDIISGEYCRCITCGRPLHWYYEAQCGHFATRDHPMTRFHKWNCHAQCGQCNNKKKGEQAKHGFKIDDLYGEGTAKSLISLSEIRGSNIPFDQRLTKVDLKEKSKEFREWARKLGREKGVNMDLLK